MNKILKITLNILVFILIIGFGYYMVRTVISKDKTIQSGEENEEKTFVSPYKKTNSFDVDSEIQCFDIYKDTVYVVLSDKISIFDLSGTYHRYFSIKAGVRDIVVEDAAIYLLYPTQIHLYSFEGQKNDEWEACSDNSDYCSFTTTQDCIFVTDAENKNIVQYDKQGGLVRFIKSPKGFIIPSYAFDIININDTVYCANSGRHQIESYTIDGEFIASFGTAGTEAGAFAGCCNPVYLEKTSNGHILTSEKGNPRISCYGKDGKFRTILFDGNTLGGGTAAYEMHVWEEMIYIANGKTILVYSKDVLCSVSMGKSCAGCKAECPLRKGVKE